MRAPEFWTTDQGLSRILEPFGRIYGAVTTARASRENAPRAPVPVISIGGVTVGGAGKTPITISLAKRLLERGIRPAVVLRGYGGSLRGPVRVDPSIHTSREVGDEALLHAAICPTWVARKRIDGARASAADGASVVLLDDGHQHPGIHKDFRIVVLDGACPFGNGFIFPAGPLRENPADALTRADAVIFMGQDLHGVSGRRPASLKQFRADLTPDRRALSLQGRAVVAFAGIGNPQKFFDMLQAIGARVMAKHPFEDHEPFGPSDIQPILDEAFAINAIPVTTAKDAVRLSDDQRQQVDVVDVDVLWDNDSDIDRLLDATLGHRR